jgi:hypothetical protein
MATKYTLLDKTAIKISTSSIAKPSKIYPKWNFWFETKQSGSTGGTFTARIMTFKS